MAKICAVDTNVLIQILCLWTLSIVQQWISKNKITGTAELVGPFNSYRHSRHPEILTINIPNPHKIIFLFAHIMSPA
jgi:hypothetical protein